MNNISRRMELVCGSIATSIKLNDTVRQHTMTLVLLMLIIEEHRRLMTDTKRIEEKCRKLNRISTQPTHTNPVYIRPRAGGWGRRGHDGEGYRGNQLSPMVITDVKLHQQQVAEICIAQFDVNTSLALLEQYAQQFSEFRQLIIDGKPRNKSQRAVQNVLLATCVDLSYRYDKSDCNPIVNVINGQFAKVANCHNIISMLVPVLSDDKGPIGRLSQTDGLAIMRQSVYYSRIGRGKAFNVAVSYVNRSRNERAAKLDRYYGSSQRYQQLLGWIVGLDTAVDAVRLLKYADSWSQYRGTNRLAYSIATNVAPYVKTLVTSRPERIAMIRHLETDVPLMRVSCVCWERYGTHIHSAAFFAKTGSETVDSLTGAIEWYHCGVSDSDDAVTDIMYSRLNADYRAKQELEQALVNRRREIAEYARKLTWLQEINMMDSKRAGNCLNGTIQFTEQLGIDCPREWTDYSVPAGLVLRKWCRSGYVSNRLLFTTIDIAVAVKKETRRIERDEIKNATIRLIASGFSTGDDNATT